MLSSFDDINVIGEAEDGQSTIKTAKRLKPNVILLDIRLPDISGLDISSKLRKLVPETKIIILTTYGREGYFQKALKVGVHAYLMKDTAHRELARAIRAVHKGDHVLSPELMTKWWDKFEDGKPAEGILSDEEINLLKMIAEGATNQEIAKKYYWSQGTVKRKIQTIYTKLNVSKRTEAVAKAIRERYI
jgi:two-component system response regulator DesR